LMRIENTEAVAISATLDASPIPSHRMKSGISPSLGSGLVNEMMKFQKSSHFADQPMRTPSGTPMMNASAKPERQRNMLMPISVSSTPFMKFAHVVSSTADRRGRNSGLWMASATTSHSTSRMMIE